MMVRTKRKGSCSFKTINPLLCTLWIQYWIQSTLYCAPHTINTLLGGRMIIIYHPDDAASGDDGEGVEDDDICDDLQEGIGEDTKNIMS